MTSESAAERHVTPIVAMAAVVLVALAAFRSWFGASLFDDTYYVTAALRAVDGARPFVGEISLQAQGQWAAMPFVWAWRELFGLTGIMLAVRLYYVALATAGAAVAYRLLRPSFHPLAALAAVSIPLLAPPYHLLAPTYNTTAALAFTLAVAFGVASIRDRHSGFAVAFGCAIVLGSVSYLPLVVAAGALLATFLVRARDARLRRAALWGTAVAGTIAALAMFAGVPLDALRTSLAFATATAEGLGTPLARLSMVAGHAIRPMLSPWLLPMWALAIAGSLARTPPRARAWCLAFVPLAAGLPGAALLAGGDHLSFGTSAASWLITVVAGLSVPLALRARRNAGDRPGAWPAFSAPAAAIGFVVIGLVSNSSWNRALPGVALAPLATCLVATWADSLSRDGGWRPAAAGVTAAVLTVTALLFATVWDDAPLTAPRATVRSGPYAGLSVGLGRLEQLDALDAVGRRMIAPTTRVGFLGEREAYLLVGGRIDTNAIWLLPARSDASVLAYYDAAGRMPDVFFVDDADVANEGGYVEAPARDPLLARILERYRFVDGVAGFSVFVLR